MKTYEKMTALLISVMLLMAAFTGCAVDAKSQTATTSESAALHCTLIVDCSVLKEKMDMLDADKTELIPEDGILLSVEKAEFTEGESVSDVLQRETRNAKLHMEVQNTPGVGSYVRGIGNLYELDAGELSGWLYRVNGEFQMIAASEYRISDGDVVEYLYTCDMGTDVGYVFDAQ